MISEKATWLIGIFAVIRLPVNSLANCIVVEKFNSTGENAQSPMDDYVYNNVSFH